MTAASRISSEIANLGCVGMAGRCDGVNRFGEGSGFTAIIYSACSVTFPLFSFSLPTSVLFAPWGHLLYWKGKANGRSFEPTCASNECAFAGSWRDVPYKYAWRDVPYKYAMLRVLT